MAEQIGIDGALLHAQSQTRGENIFKLHPQESGVQFFEIHVQILENEKADAESRSTGVRSQQFNPSEALTPRPAAVAREKHASKNPPPHEGSLTAERDLPRSGRSLDRYEERACAKKKAPNSVGA